MGWDNIKSVIFTLTGVENNKNADKLFISLLLEIERKAIDIKKQFVESLFNFLGISKITPN